MTIGAENDDESRLRASVGRQRAYGAWQQPDLLRIETITVQPGRVVCEVAVDPLRRYTDPALASALLAEHSTLRSHACVNDVGETFGDVIERTSVPHLLEHLVIDLQTRSDGRPNDTFVGTTEWVDERAGRAIVQVSFADDLVCLRAFRDAAEKINAAMESVNGKGTA